MRRAKSLRIGVHHADAAVWGLVYRTRLDRLAPPPSRRELVRGDETHGLQTLLVVVRLVAYDPAVLAVQDDGRAPLDAVLHLVEERVVLRDGDVFLTDALREQR